MSTSFSIIHAFAGLHFGGSPTPVCFSAEPLLPGDMLPIAAELALPVTAFVWPQETGAYAIRYFTPLMEIGACGHATLAAAALLARRTKAANILFETTGGRLIPAAVVNDGVTLHYPVLSMIRADASEKMLQALNLHECDQALHCPQLETLFLVLSMPDEVENLAPRFERLATLKENIHEVVVTAACQNEPYDYCLRSFCPWIGINEDPVTGSVHAALAPFWAARLGKKLLRARQASERGGEMQVVMEASEVLISGNCVFATTREAVC